MTDTPLTFGAFQFDPQRRALLRNGTPVRLGSRALDVLAVLVERPGEQVSKQALMERVWPDTFVEEANLRVHIAALRRILGGGGTNERFIATVAGQGYCFVGRIEDASATLAAAGVQQAAPSVPAPNLPAALTRAIGRDDVVKLIAARLAERRFVTVVGPGGIGKTTVAVAVAGNLAHNYKDGVCFVDLGPLADHRLVPSAIASVLGIATQAERPLASVAVYLRNRAMLVVLDNCEHVIEAAAELAEGILRGAPGVHLLTTSREPFRAEGESLYRLAPLAVPPQDAALAPAAALAFPAVELFVERATALAENFALGDANVATVCEICRRLDGMPLAIELAAARVDHFGVQAVAARLADRFSLLSLGRRTALPQRQTLRAALDWSYGLLSEIEQVAFRRLAPMAGAFDMAMAVAVLSDVVLPARDVMGLISDLIDKSFVVADVGGRQVQYRLFETMRAYASERLAQSTEEATVRCRYATYVLEHMRSAEAEWKAQPGAEWRAWYAGGLGDVRAALDWALSPAGDAAIGIDLTIDSAPLWFELSLAAEYAERTAQALQVLDAAPRPDAAMQLRLLLAQGYALWYGWNDPGPLEPVFARALPLAEQLGDTPAKLQALWGTWAIRRGHGAFREALAIASEYAAMAATTGDRNSIVLGDRILGLTRHYLGMQDEAFLHVERVYSLSRGAVRAPNSDWQVDAEVAMASLLARIQWLQGFGDQAEATARDAMAAAQRLGHWFSLCYALYMAGCPLSLWTGDMVEAQTRIEMLVERAAGTPSVDRIARCFAVVLRLRNGTESERLVAACIEPRMEPSQMSALDAMTSVARIAVPLPDPEIDEDSWNAPELLRVNAELVLWHALPDAAELAQELLLRARVVARRQSALAWELRVATSLARLWRSDGRVGEGRELLGGVCERFTEGFASGDYVVAEELLAQLG